MGAALLTALGGSARPAAAAPEKVAEGIRFSYSDPNAAAVFWVGDFNSWNNSANPMAKNAQGMWTIVLALPQGEHQYKFFVDGRWIADPANPATVGEFGNSVVRVGGAGELLATQATSNVPYSPKISIGGRVIGLYQASRNLATDRFELRRPDMDIDLNFGIRMSDALSARFLLNIRSEAEDVEFFRTRLNFDRGQLMLTRPAFQVLAYDNEAVGTWDDPLHLVGDVGIYRHAYGFERQGFRFTGQRMGFDLELDYADNFKPGGTSYPTYSFEESTDLAGSTSDSLQTVRDGSGFVLAPGQTFQSSRITVSDNNENMLAFRLRHPLIAGLRAGVLGRFDRGFNLGTTVIQRVTGPLAFQTVFGTFDQEWYAAGGELAWSGPSGFAAAAEFLQGKLRMNLVNQGNFPQILEVTVTGIDSTGVTSSSGGPSRAAIGERIDLDQSNRMALQASWTESHGDIVVRAGLEIQDHAYEIIQHGLENSVRLWNLDWDRNWRYYLNREVKTRLGVEFFDFDYDPRTPWGYQLWFPTGNFWLENGEHLVSFDRLTMLGGNDVASVKTGVTIPIRELGRRIGPVRLDNATFEYRGTLNFESLDRRPRYAESIFRFGIDLGPSLRLNTDSRWAKYDDPRLQLGRGYLDHFGELVYRFAPGIDVALSAGVDPWVIDPITNEYAYIGRDQFLFAQGANAGTAETNFFGLGRSIIAAEHALRAERRIQVKANVVF